MHKIFLRVYSTKHSIIIKERNLVRSVFSSKCVPKIRKSKDFVNTFRFVFVPDRQRIAYFLRIGQLWFFDKQWNRYNNILRILKTSGFQWIQRYRQIVLPANIIDGFTGAFFSVIILGEPIVWIFIVVTVIVAAGCWLVRKKFPAFVCNCRAIPYLRGT